MSYTNGNEEEEVTDKAVLIKETLFTEEKTACIRTRFIIAALSFSGLAIVLSQRASFSVALVAMVNFTEVNEQDNATGAQCAGVGNQSHVIDRKLREGEFDWDGTTQSNLLAAFSYGYVSLQLLGGYIGERYSLKTMVGLCVLVPSILHGLTPVIARWNVNALIATRVLTGLTTSPIFPCNAAIWGRWAPLMERTTLVAVVVLGGNAGIVMATPVAGFLCDSDFLGGWPAVFYILGLLGCLWFVAWWFLMYDSPRDHPRISVAERDYIEFSLKVKADVKYIAVPWLSLMTSRPVWVMNFSYFCDGFGFYVAFSCFPLFLRQVLKYDTSMNGTMLSLIYLANTIIGIIGGFIADYMRRNTRLSITVIRKLFSVSGHGGAGLGCLGVALFSCDKVLAVVFMILGLGLAGLAQSGFGINPIDLSPRYSGTLMGLANGIGNIGGFLAPVLINLITHGTGDKTAWSYVFFMTAGVFLVSALVYLLLGSGEEQPWAGGVSKKDVHDAATVN